MVDRFPEATREPVAFQADVEFMPRAELEALQGCLRAEAVHRAMGAPFFRERLAAWESVPDAISAEQFQEQVPLTTKQDLREARESAWVTAARDRIVLVLATSGTTGTRVALPYSRQDMQQWHTLVARTLWANGLRPWDTTLLPVPISLFTGGHAMLGGLLRLGCTVLPTGAVPPPAMADVLRGGLGTPPTAIVALPSHMLRMLDAFHDLGYDPAASALRVGSFGAEAWSEGARQRLEEGYGLRATDSYGIGELCGPGIAAECELRAGMHLWEDAFFVEIIDPASGEPVPDGTPGELVLTPLFREVFPVLRYRTGDEASIIPEPCSCGRTHRRISRIVRRLDSVLIITGVNIDPGDIEHILYGFPWLGNEFYLEAGGENRDQLVVHVERKADGEAPAEAEAAIIERIRRDFHVRTVVRLYDPGRLERAPGKAQRIRG